MVWLPLEVVAGTFPVQPIKPAGFTKPKKQVLASFRDLALMAFPGNRLISTPS